MHDLRLYFVGLSLIFWFSHDYIRRLSFVVGLILYYAQVFLSRLAFLQADKEDKKKKKKKTIHLSLNNRLANSWYILAKYKLCTRLWGKWPSPETDIIMLTQKWVCSTLFSCSFLHFLKIFPSFEHFFIITILQFFYINCVGFSWQQ